MRQPYQGQACAKLSPTTLVITVARPKSGVRTSSQITVSYGRSSGHAAAPCKASPIPYVELDQTSPTGPYRKEICLECLSAVLPPSQFYFPKEIRYLRLLSRLFLRPIHPSPRYFCDDPSKTTQPHPSSKVLALMIYNVALPRDTMPLGLPSYVELDTPNCCLSSCEVL